MLLYKLTDSNGQTLGNTQWGDGVTVHAARGIPILCSRTVIHAYRDPILAVLMNPIHGDFVSPLLWEAEGDVIVDDGTKVGCKSLTTLHQIPLPQLTRNQRIRFAILVAKTVCKRDAWHQWANRWLSGEDRTTEADAAAAHAAAYAAARAALSSHSELDLVALAHRAVQEES